MEIVFASIVIAAIMIHNYHYQWFTGGRPLILRLEHPAPVAQPKQPAKSESPAGATPSNVHYLNPPQPRRNEETVGGWLMEVAE